MQILAAYLQGYNLLELKTENPLNEDHKTFISSIFSGITDPELTRDFTYKISFKSISQSSLNDNFSKMGIVFEGLKKTIMDSYEDFPDKDALTNNYIYAKDLERILDNLTLQVRRYLNLALSYSEFYDLLKLRTDIQIIYINTIFGSFERLGDLHTEIISNMINLIDMDEKISIFNDKDSPFIEYYANAYDIICTGLDAIYDPSVGMDVIRSKMSEPTWSLYKKGVLVELKNKIKDEIVNVTNPQSIRQLTILEGKLRAIPDIVSNICEFAYNMNSNAQTSFL